ncbi:hypothetical protein [Devosia sp. MC521]|uniref:hypothetical protein n=1 Tax=Devosia sp. MC521 TaxID=2759954 RepID=UPI0015FE6C23|nr:hypothetical protein [Devosia sp. MC521]MBJ6986882.1 hypothetical protein [Devosia sp. MC521]QMW63911.1 hypothetical protein H4N61_06220 [Devosia sp. MC521]
MTEVAAALLFALEMREHPDQPFKKRLALIQKNIKSYKQVDISLRALPKKMEKTTGQKIKKDENNTTNKDCFVIMPISEFEGYDPNHFRHVYDDIIKPACDVAGFSAVRADDVQASNFIHLDILRKTIESPVAICDLSTRNPNVLFELGIRQAFDLPVVLIQEKGTPKIFDIGPIRCLDYSKEMRYHDVVETQRKLSEAITETQKSTSDSGNVNSIVRLLSLTEPAKIPDVTGQKDAMSMDVLRTEMHYIRKMVEDLTSTRGPLARPRTPVSLEYERIASSFERAQASFGKAEHTIVLREVNGVIEDIARALKYAEGSRIDPTGFRILLDRAETLQNRLIKEVEDLPF